MSDTLSAEQQHIGAYWNATVKKKRPKGWMTHPWVVSRVNELVGGVRSNVWGDGLLVRLQQLIDEQGPLRRGISVACGKGAIELNLVRKGIIESFDCFDLANERVQAGRLVAVRSGLSDRFRPHCADAFKEPIESGSYDLVYWRNALHHMMDTRAAIEWSFRILRPGGIVYLDDYVGPSRFQYSDEQVERFNLIRKQLPPNFFRDSSGNKRRREFKKADMNAVIRADPSEAADSANIMPAFREFFPSAFIVPVSAGVFPMLKDIIGNLDSEQDSKLLEWLWECDRTMISNGEVTWVSALATKH